MEPKAPHANCSICPLANAKFVPSSLPPNATVALVSRSPGNHDTTAPFTGPLGPVVDYLLKRYGSSREKIILTNVVLCQTDEPSKEAIECCRPRLENELSGATTIIAAGSEAVAALTGIRSVTRARGYVHTINQRRVIAANNPALVLRESDKFPTLVTDFKLALDPLPSPIFPTVEVINDPLMARDRLRQLLDSANKSTITATDLEWSGTDIYCAGFSTSPNAATVFGRNVITDVECFGLVKRIYESNSIHTCWHNGKSDTSVLWANGIRGRVDEDTLLLSYAIDEEPGRHSLDYLLQTHFGWPNYEPESVNYFKKQGHIFGSTDEERLINEQILYEYNGWDAAGTYQLYDKLSVLAAFDDVHERPYKSVLQPAANAFRSVELHGFRYNAEESANLLEAEVLPKLKELIEQMQSLSGLALLNPRSTAQMYQLYYIKWGLKHKLRDKPKQKLSTSTGKEVREEIEGGRFFCNPEFKVLLTEFASLHRRYAKIERQRSNYFQSLIEKVDNRGYIHPWFNLAGTVTGRTSSTEPNFQNITRQGVEGISSVRTLFLPSEGNVLVQADYSQAELRTMAKLSGDKNMLGIYRDNTRSLHKERAAAFYGENYTKEEYVKSKNINFGVSYDQSAAMFAQMYHMSKEEAQAYIDSWWREFYTLKKWTDEIKAQALTGVVIAPLGYKRRFHLITDANKEAIKREAVNFVPQNTAGGFTICAVTELCANEGFQWSFNNEIVPGVPIVNSVHDSIVVDVPRADSLRVARVMKEVMEKQPKKLLGWDDIPFTVDVSIGETWASVEEIEL